MKEIMELKCQGLSFREISGLTGYDPKTVRKYLREQDVFFALKPVARQRTPHRNSLSPTLNSSMKR